jgi:glucose-6-phosphate 1-epimerase
MTDRILLKSPDGAQAEIALHGAHVLSWVPAGAPEQLYLSPRSEFAPGKAIRGGVPMCFPQFAERGPLPKHGFARNQAWRLVSQDVSRDDAMAVLALDGATADVGAWARHFELELTVRLAGQVLDLELACTNTGEAPLSFTAALHTYLRVADLNATSLAGLAGLRYWDSITQRDERQRVELLLPGESGVVDLDRIYFQAKEPLLLSEHRLNGRVRRVLITSQGFDDAVVWNPGPERCAKLVDMPADGWRHMLCVEAASVGIPVELPAGETWVGRQSLSLEAAG